MLFLVPASVYAKIQVIRKYNKIEFTLADYDARDSITCSDLLIQKARSLFEKKIIPLRVTIKNMTEQDIVFSPSSITQADRQDLYDVCKHSEVAEPMAIIVIGSWLAALLFLAEDTRYVRVQWSMRGGIAALCALTTCALSLRQQYQAKQKNKIIKDAFEARVQEVTITAGGTYDMVLFIDEIDLWQRPVMKVRDVHGQVVASCPLNLGLNFNFSHDIVKHEYQEGLK